jgi:hypothetical protein
VPSRRFPIYWDQRSSRGETARRLIAARGINIVPAADADELFTGLLSSVEALDRLAEPPLSTAIALQRLKRYIPNPVHRIDLHDLMLTRIEPIAAAIEKHGVTQPHRDGQMLQDVYDDYVVATRPLLDLLMEGIYHDVDDTHLGLWTDIFSRVLNLRPRPSPGPRNPILAAATHFPALLVFAVATATAMQRGREHVITTLSAVTWEDIEHGAAQQLTAADALHLHRVVPPEAVEAFPRWADGPGWVYPPSHYPPLRPEGRPRPLR